MADLSINFAGIRSPNPFWLASAPPTNSGYQVMKAFDAGWGGAVWKTLGVPVINVSSRYGGVNYRGSRLIGLNNIELITDRPLKDNLREIEEVKKYFPNHAVITSLMVETREQWHQIVKDAESAGSDGHELNFGCPHGMCERGMGSAVGQEPEILKMIVSWVKEVATKPVIVKLTPNITDITEPARAAREGGGDAVSLINTIQSLVGVDIDNFVSYPVVDGESTNGGYCGPAVKPIALNMVKNCAQDPLVNIPVSGIGGIENWRDAVEFILLGAGSVQVCTAVMHFGFGIIREMITGLNSYMDEKGFRTIEEMRGKALPNIKNWENLNLDYKVIAHIHEDKCIGCQLCYTACEDGAHQAIGLPSYPPFNEGGQGGSLKSYSPETQTSLTEANASQSISFLAQSPYKHQTPPSRIPFIIDENCVGCNLCSIICPVQGCITMDRRDDDTSNVTWKDRTINGTIPVTFNDELAGGLHHWVPAPSDAFKKK